MICCKVLGLQLFWANKIWHHFLLLINQGPPDAQFVRSSVRLQLPPSTAGLASQRTTSRFVSSYYYYVLDGPLDVLLLEFKRWLSHLQPAGARCWSHLRSSRFLLDLKLSQLIPFFLKNSHFSNLTIRFTKYGVPQGIVQGPVSVFNV